jgi:ribosomal protein S18 acetylase RimI-like enzyme
MPPRVRPSTPDDLPQLGRMGAQLMRLHHALDPARFMAPPADVEAGYASWLGAEAKKPKALVLVAQAEDGAVVGYAYGRLEGRDWNALRDPCGMLYDVWVDEPHRRSGAGQALCEAVKAAFRERGAPRVILMSAAANAPAQRLFARLGWRPSMVEMTCELAAE